MSIKYSFTAELWVYPGEAAWYFITLPTEYAEEIRLFSEHVKRGFGSVRVTAQIGQSTWNTSVFPESKIKSYILPVKKEIRVKNHLQVGDVIKLLLTIDT